MHVEPKKPHGNTNPHREEAIKAIKDHLARHGSKNWKPIFDQFEGRVHDVTLWGWIRVAKKDSVEMPVLSAAKAAIEAEMPRNLPAELGRDLPLSPSPNYIAKAGKVGLRKFDMVRELENCYGDALMLRTYATKVVKDEITGEERESIKNPLVFEKQLSRRLDVMDTTLRAMKEVWDLRAMQGFYEVVVEEIGRADPATQQRILQRLAVLNSETGFNMNMRV